MRQSLGGFIAAAFCILGGSYSAQAAPIVTPHDTIPDFCESPTKTSVGSGNWSSGSTWSGGSVPGAGDRVVIGAGHTVTFDASSTPSLYCLGIRGTLNFRTDTNTSLRAGTILVYDVGHLIVGTTANPVAANVTAEIVIANQPLNLGSDPGQYGTGLIAFGEWKMHGAVKTPTYMRLASEPLAGQSTLTLQQSVTGWRVGDRVIIPDTRHLSSSSEWNFDYGAFVSQAEDRTITAVSGNQITLNSPLQYNHFGARNGITNALDFLPHVGNITRNVAIRSETPTGTRGHTLATVRADVDIRYSQFKQLGRTTIDELNDLTNHIGRYPTHFHHLFGNTTTPSNGYQYTFQGNSVEDAGSGYSRLKWAITVHDSHYGLISDNVIFNIGGAAIMTEDGNESFNVFERNFVVHRGQGTGGRDGLGRESSGIYMRGPMNYVRDNVVTNILSDGVDSAYSYKFFFRFLGKIRVPNFKGASTVEGSGQYAILEGNAEGILQFENNEGYGATESGLTYWWVGTWETDPFDGQSPPGEANAKEAIIKNFKVWNVHNKGIFHYAAHKLTIDGWVMRRAAHGGGHALDFSDYFAKNIIIRNSDIQGSVVGISGSPIMGHGTVTIKDTTFLTQLGMIIGQPGSVSAWLDELTEHQFIFDNVKFIAPPGGRYANNTHPTGAIRLMGNGEGRLLPDRFYIYNHNQVPGANYQIFYLDQAPDYIVPQQIFNSDGSLNAYGAPEPGRTNQYWMNLYPDGRYTVSRMIAPCLSTMSGFIDAYVCTLSGNPPPPPPSASRCDINASGAVDVNDIQLCVNQTIGVAPCTTADINLDSQCTVVDVQRVVNASLGGQCVSP
jgi:hypothetical protein